MRGRAFRTVRRLGYAAAGLALLAAGPARAVECRLALLLALDVSSSVNATEDALQRRGLARALLSPDVERAFFIAPQHVALAVYEWSGRYNQKILLNWTLIESPAALYEAAATLASSERSTTKFPTALGYALGYGATMFQSAPRCLYNTIDVSGDGKNNEGFGPEEAYNAFAFRDIVVNGLAINAAEFEAETDLIPYYKNEVLHGPGAFLEIATGYADFERAMKRKLERELSPPTLGLLPPVEDTRTR
ncbi:MULTISPECIES: DUF1194 domain-containing protein [Shimia]|uniref:DUF1194 domain-containing protein n=1 Tax=Shimia TaxID=573139 RepID=UPI001FB42DA1|nr:MULTISPECIES: DUF1194 domain-containing protein [Shimia]MDV4145415.1 DUF1194 domain-containing protein [Shimia sp. FJ5]